MVYNLVLAQFGYVPALTPAERDPEARMLELVRRRPGLGLEHWPDQRLRALQRVIANNLDVVSAYRPGMVHCPLLFFLRRPVRTDPGREAAELGAVRRWPDRSGRAGQRSSPDTAARVDDEARTSAL